MAVPTQRAVGAIANTSAAVAPTIPAAAVAGDLLICVTVNETQLNTMATVPTGWTLIDLFTDDPGQDFTIAVYWAECTSGGSNDPSDTPSWTWTTADRTTARIVAFQDADMTTPIHGTPVRTGAATVSQLNVGPFTTTVADCLIVGIITTDYSASEGTTWTLPGGVSTVWNETGLAGSDAPAGNIVQAVFTEAAATASTYGAYSCSNTVADDMGGLCFAIAPGSTATLDQERYRWRKDDGSEATATWEAAENTGMTAPVSTTKRLRVQIDATGDPASEQFELQYKRSGDTNWDTL